MALDVFMKIDGIPGECQDDKHKDWIEILSYSTGVSQAAGAASRSTAGAATGGRADFQDFVFTKNIDKTSPKLALFCAQGKRIKEITVALCRATGEKAKYMEYKLTEVIITSVSTVGQSSTAADVPTESVSLNFGKIEYTYVELDHKDGKKKGEVKSNWSIVENKGA